MELLIYRLIRVSVIYVWHFCLIKYVLYDFVWFSKKKKKSNVHLLYSLIHVFIYLFIYFLFYLVYSCLFLFIIYNKWQNFAKRLAKAFRKTSHVCPHMTQGRGVGGKRWIY